MPTRTAAPSPREAKAGIVAHLRIDLEDGFAAVVTAICNRVHVCVRLSAVRRFNCAYGARFCACRQVRSRQYGRLSAPIHQPQAARAVGSAVGANPIAFIIPCRGVIGETGVLGNYRWDPLRKTRHHWLGSRDAGIRRRSGF